MGAKGYDTAVRQQLRALKNLADFARTIGKRQPWLHKYANGGGKASIDDIIAIGMGFPGWTGSLDAFLARLGGPLPEPLTLQDVARTREEKRLLRLWRKTPDGDDQARLLALAETYARETRRHQQAQTRQERDSGTPAAAKRTKRGRRRGGGSSET